MLLVSAACCCVQTFIHKGLLVRLSVSLIEVICRLSCSNTDTNKIIKICSFILPDILPFQNQIASAEHRAFSHRGIPTYKYCIEHLVYYYPTSTLSHNTLLPTYPSIHLYTTTYT